MNGIHFRIGYWSAILAAAAMVGYVIVQLMQLWGYVHFPLDARLIYGCSLVIVLPFLLAMLSLHYAATARKRFWTHGALLFVVMYAVFVTANYVVQLATVIPMTLQGGRVAVQLLDQTPHSMFWDYDALGYIFMGLASFMAAPSFEGEGISRWTRIFFYANAAITPLITIVYFYPVFTPSLIFLALPWAVTAPGMMVMLALWLRNRRKTRVLAEMNFTLIKTTQGD